MIVTWILPEYSSNPFEHCIALGDSSLIESFLSIIFTQINQLTLQSVEISLHGCVIIGTSCFTHALCHMNRFAKFYECFGSIMQIYDCTVVAYFMVFQKQIGKIGTPFLTVLSLCGHNDLPSGVFGIFMLFIKTIKLEKHCFPNLIICLLSTQEENSILAGRIT